MSRFSLQSVSPYSFIDVDGVEFQESGGSYANKEECAVVVDLVERITNSGKIKLDEDKLRIITFYQGQVNLLKRLLAKRGLRALVATVDSSQGCESDVVIVSFVRSSDKKGVYHATGFLGDDRRVNVALTRARYQLICVGNAKGTFGSRRFRSFVLDAEKRGCIVSDKCIRLNINYSSCLFTSSYHNNTLLRLVNIFNLNSNVFIKWHLILDTCIFIDSVESIDEPGR